MAKYISLPITGITGVPSSTFNTDLITTVLYTGATSFVIWAFGKSYTFGTTGTGSAAAAVAGINAAILAQNGPGLANVVLSTGTITSITQTT